MQGLGAPAKPTTTLAFQAILTSPMFQAIPTSHNTNVLGYPSRSIPMFQAIPTSQHQCFRPSQTATTPMFQAIPASHNTNVLAYSGNPNQPHLISCSRHSSLSRASFFTVRSSSIKSVRREVSSPLVCSRSLDRCCNRDCRSDTSPSCAWVRREICPKEHQQDLVILSHPSRHHEGSYLTQDHR